MQSAQLKSYIRHITIESRKGKEVSLMEKRVRDPDKVEELLMIAIDLMSENPKYRGYVKKARMIKDIYFKLPKTYVVHSIEEEAQGKRPVVEEVTNELPSMEHRPWIENELSEQDKEQLLQAFRLMEE